MKSQLLTGLFAAAAALAGQAQTETLAVARAQAAAAAASTPDSGSRPVDGVLPKVLTLVPWKQPLPAPPSGRPPQGVLDEPMTPLDRAVFRRQMDYIARPAAISGEPGAAVPPRSNVASGAGR